MSNQEWLDGLRPGDQVLVWGTGYGREFRVSRVVRRTPSGQIVLTGGERFSKYGVTPGDKYFRCSLAPATPERLDELERKTIARRIHGLKLEEMSLEALRQAATILLPTKDS